MLRYFFICNKKLAVLLIVFVFLVSTFCFASFVPKTNCQNNMMRKDNETTKSSDIIISKLELDKLQVEDIYGTMFLISPLKNLDKVH